VVLALSTGARRNEILTLKWDNIDFKRQVITLEETKNGERRLLPLQGYAFDLIFELFKNRSVFSDYLFPGEAHHKPVDITKSWNRALKYARIDDFRFHDLRHSAASYLAMDGGSITDIAEVLGHKTLQMARRYAHLSEAHTKKVVASMNEKIFSDEGEGED
jgi:integrase